MKHKPVLVIVGRPNVGKSCLYNRIAGHRAAVVDDMSGVTRDRNYTAANWGAVQFLIADTGGVMPPSDDMMTESIREQVELAIDEADSIIFLTDVTTGPTDLDLYIARMLRKKALERVVVVANKAESPHSSYDLGAFMKLGLGEAMPVSALHGHGIRSVLDRVVGLFSANPRSRVAHDQDGLRIAILGRPNAGKSSLVNKLLNSHRMIVHDQPGTTRDAIDSHLTWHGKNLVLIDTAGLRKKARVEDRVEYYSNLRALESINRADVCVLMIDAKRGIGEQDLRILNQINKAHKGIVVCLNKWDLVEKDYSTFDSLVKELRGKYVEMKFAPILSVSALTGQRVQTVLEQVVAVRERMGKHVSVGRFRSLLRTWTMANPHPIVRGKPVKVLGGNQAPAQYPLFLVFASHHALVTQSYARFLQNNIQAEFDFEGCPLTIMFREPSAPMRGRNRYAHMTEEGSEGEKK